MLKFYLYSYVCAIYSFWERMHKDWFWFLFTWVADADDPLKTTDQTRRLGLIVCFLPISFILFIHSQKGSNFVWTQTGAYVLILWPDVWCRIASELFDPKLSYRMSLDQYISFESPNDIGTNFSKILACAGQDRSSWTFRAVLFFSSWYKARAYCCWNAFFKKKKLFKLDSWRGLTTH